MMKRALVVVAAMGVAAIPGVALAQHEQPTVYVGVFPTTTTVVAPTTTTTVVEAPTTTLGEEVKGQVETQPTQALADPGGSLPVTGGDVMGLTAIGAGLVAIGAGLARARRRSTQS